MTDLKAALVERFLTISVTQEKAAVPPDGVLDDADGDSTAVRLIISHGQSADPGPVKATQPYRYPIRPRVRRPFMQGMDVRAYLTK